MEMNITKELFLKYERIKLSGEYNMVTQSDDVMKMMNIDLKTYIEIIVNYSELFKKYLGNVQNEI